MLSCAVRHHLAKKAQKALGCGGWPRGHKLQENDSGKRRLRRRGVKQSGAA